MSAYDIKSVPMNKRDLGFTDMFSIWFGAGISIAEFWAGALLAPGMALQKALAAILIGHGIGNLLLSIVSLAGYRTGLPTMVLLRRTFGRAGSYMASALNFIQLVGWTAIMLIVGGQAASAVSLKVYHRSLLYFWIILQGILVTLWALAGPKLWRSLEKLSMALLFILTLYTAYYVFLHRGSLQPIGENKMSFWVGVDLVVAMPVSWAPLAADYSRFSKSSKSSLWGTFVGYFLSSGLFYFIGAYTNMFYGQSDPISLIALVGLGIPAFLIIIFSTITTTFMDVYSAGISFKNIFEKIDARFVVVLTGFAGTLLALFFPMDRYEGFLLLIGGLFVPLSAILVIDYLVETASYLGGEKKMPFSANIFVWAAGFILYLLLSIDSILGVNAGFFSRIGGLVGASIPDIVFVLFLYMLLRLFLTHKNKSKRI